MARRSVDPGQKQQNTIIILSFFIYAMAYFGRYSFSSSINSFISEYKIDKAQTGLVMTFFFVAYGVGQVVNGFLCKYYPKKYIFPIALWSSSFINLIIFAGIKTGYIGPYFYLVKYIWFLNGVVQSLIWTSLIFTLSENIEQKNLAKTGTVLGMTVPVGTFAAYSVSSLMERLNCYEWSFVLAAAVMGMTGLAWLIMYKPYQRTDIEPDSSEQPQKKAISPVSVAVLMTVISLSVFAVANNFIKDGLQTWIPTILKDTYRFSNAASLILATSVYLLGVLGTFIAKKLNEKIDNLVMLSILFFAVIAVCSLGIATLLETSPVLVIVFFCIVMISGYATNNIVTSLAPLFLRNFFNPGVIAGVLDGFCYVGSAITSYLLGLVADKLGWNAVGMLFFIIAAVSVTVTLLLELLSKKKSA